MNSACPISSGASESVPLAGLGLLHLCGWTTLQEHHSRKRERKTINNNVKARNRATNLHTSFYWPSPITQPHLTLWPVPSFYCQPSLSLGLAPTDLTCRGVPSPHLHGLKVLPGIYVRLSEAHAASMHLRRPPRCFKQALPVAVMHLPDLIIHIFRYPREGGRNESPVNL